MKTRVNKSNREAIREWARDFLDGRSIARGEKNPDWAGTISVIDIWDAELAVRLHWDLTDSAAIGIVENVAVSGHPLRIKEERMAISVYRIKEVTA